MAEQWHYNVVIFIQAGEGRGGLGNQDVNIDHMIDSFEILESIREGLTAKLFPDGCPDLPEHVQPVVVISWQLITAKRGAGVAALKPEDNGHDQ